MRKHSLYNPVSGISMPYKQHGVVGIMAVLLLLVVVVLMVEVISERATTNLIDSSLFDNSLEAELLAESGVERAAWRYLNQEVWCASNGLGETNIEIVAGSGNTVTLASYKTDILGNTLGAGQCRIVATATMASNGISRTINSIIFGSVLIEELFPNIDRWSTAGPTGDTFFTDCAETTSVTLQANDGTVEYDSATDSTGDGGGSFHVFTPSGKNLDQTGYRTYTSLKAAYPGAVMTIYHDYMKTKGRNPRAMMMAIDLVSTVATGSTVYRVWCSDTPTSTIGGFVTDGAFTWTVPAGKYIDTVRLSYDLGNTGVGQPTGNNVWFDTIKITYF